MTVVNGGTGYVQASTTITIAAPRDTTIGNYAAQARAVVDKVSGAIVEVRIVDPGKGYVSGETAEVTFLSITANPAIPGGTGANALAIGAATTTPRSIEHKMTPPL